MASSEHGVKDISYVYTKAVRGVFTKKTRDIIDNVSSAVSLSLYLTTYLSQPELDKIRNDYERQDNETAMMTLLRFLRSKDGEVFKDFLRALREINNTGLANSLERQLLQELGGFLVALSGCCKYRRVGIVPQIVTNRGLLFLE